MTFFNQEQKLKYSSPSQKAGPGSYSLSSLTEKNRSFAPFGSLSKK